MTMGFCSAGLVGSLVKRLSYNRRDTDAESESSREVPTTRNASPKTPHVRPKFRFFDKYEDVKGLPAGGQGECSVVRSKRTGNVFVVKRVKVADEDYDWAGPKIFGRRKAFSREAKILRRLFEPPHIIHLFGVEQHCMVHTLYLEYCSGGDLWHQLKKFDELEVLSPPIFTLHVLKGFHYFQATGHKSIIHGDIKPENIFLQWPSQELGLPHVVLADFGAAPKASESRGTLGTPGYDPPEVLAVERLLQTDRLAAFCQVQKTQIMTPKSDMYQLGLVLHLMATGEHFKLASDTGLIEMCSAYQNVKGLMAFIVWCLQPDPADRPECTDAMEDGILFAMEMLRMKRDAMYDPTEVTDQKIWNICEV